LIATPLSGSIFTNWIPVAADHRSIIVVTCASSDMTVAGAKPMPGAISTFIDERLFPGQAVSLQ